MPGDVSGNPYGAGNSLGNNIDPLDHRINSLGVTIHTSPGINAGVNSAIAQGVVVSGVDPVSATGWMDWNNTEEYLIKALNITDAGQRIKEKWLEAFGEETYRNKYYFIANTTPEIVAYVSDSATGPTDVQSTIFIWSGSAQADKLIVQQNATNATNNGNTSTSTPSLLDTENNVGLLLSVQLNALLDDNNGNIQNNDGTNTDPAPIPYREDFTPIDPSTMSISPGSLSQIFAGIVRSDSLRFDINSSNMFSGMIEDQLVEESIISDSNSPVEKEGISANRLKTLIVSDYDLTDTIGQSVLASSLEYSKLQHDNLYKFYNNVLFPEVELLTDLEEIYNRKKSRLLKSIQFIKEIDEFKFKFINTIADYNSHGLQILGYLPGLNTTTAIRQAFYDLSSYVETGGYFLSNNLNGVYETVEGITTNQSFNPRVLSNDFNTGYVFQSANNWTNNATEILEKGTKFYSVLANNRSAFGNYVMYVDRDGFESQRRDSIAALKSSLLYAKVAEDWNTFNEYIDELYNDSPSAKAAHLAQGLYVNILKSYIVNSNNLSNAEDLGEEYFGTRNYLLGIAGDAIDDRQGAPKPLASLDNTKKLAQILRYNSSENNVFPFEKPNVNFSGDLTNSVSGIEKWFDTNIGNVLEGRQTDFRGLDNFSKLFDDIILKTEKKLNAFNLKGHGQTIFNEIIRAFQKVYNGALDTETHPQPGVAEEAGKGGFIFDDYDSITVEFTAIDVLEDKTNGNSKEETENETVAAFTESEKEAAKIEHDIVQLTVQTGLEDVANELAYINSVQEDMEVMFEDIMSDGSIMPSQPSNGDEFIDSSEISASMIEITGEELYGTGGEGYVAATMGISVNTANAVGESGFNLLGGAGTGATNILSSTPMLQMASGTQMLQTNFTGYAIQKHTAADSRIDDDLSIEQGMLDAELRVLASKGKEHHFRKLLLIIDMFENISKAGAEEFFNLSYNSIQGQVEINPATPGVGIDPGRYKKYVGLLAGNKNLYINYNTGIAAYCHGLSIINSVCAEVEKNIAYNVAVASNEYGITNRTPREYSDSNAISILSTVFNNTDTKLIYTRANGLASINGVDISQVLGSSASKDVFLAGHNIGEGSATPNALSHIQLRALVLQIISLTCKVIKSQNKISKSLTSQVANPGNTDKSKVSKLYVAVNSNIDRIKTEAMVAQMFLPVVENIDPDKGPVRWQISYGNWADSGLKLENESFVDQYVVPKGVEKTLAGEFSSNVELAGHVIPSGDLEAYTLSLGQTPAELGYGLGTLESLKNAIKNVEASVKASYAFLLKKEDIIPYNFIDNKEIPIKSFAISPPRGGLSTIIKSCIYHREDSRRLMEYLKSVSKHYSLAQQSMEGLAKDPNGAELAESVTLPGIEANEIINYSSLRQTFLRSFLASEESGIERSGYSPSATYMDKDVNPMVVQNILNKLLLSVSLIEPFIVADGDNAEFFLGKSDSTRYGDPGQIPELGRQASDNHLKFGKIITVGIPSGLIDQNKKSKPLNVLNRLVFIEQEFEPLIDREINPLWRCFWPALFINRAELIRVIKQMGSSGGTTNWYSMLSKIKYGTIDKDTGRYVLKDMAAIKSYIEENIISSPDMVMPTQSWREDSDASGGAVVAKPTALHILVNHVLDALLKLYMDLYAGLNVSESSFSVNLQSNVLYVDQTCLDNIDLILEHAGIKSADDILDGNMIIPFKSFYKKQTSDSNTEIAYEKYAKFISTTQSRLFSADQMTTMALVPNIFDRTFNIWSHMGQVSFYTINDDRSQTLTFYNISDDGTFDSSGSSTNMAFNDFNAQTYFRSYSS